MAVGQNGRPVRNTTGDERPGALDVGKHIHKGGALETCGGPGATTAPGASLSGSSGSSPYGSGGDGS